MLKLIDHPNFEALRTALHSLGLWADVPDGHRRDAAGDTLFLARELEQVSATTYDVLIDPIKGRTLVPFNSSVSEGAETFSYDMYDGFALAEWITNWASAVGQADAFKKRTAKTMRSFGSGYSYTVQDLAASAFGGRAVDRERAVFARKAHELFLDDLIAVGDATRGIEGLTNSTTIPTVAPAVGTWDAATTTTDLMKDLDKLVQTPEQASKGNFKANRLVLPLSVKPLLSQVFSTSDARTVQTVWLANQDADGVRSIDYWARLNTASALSGPRALTFKADASVFEFLLSYDYRELPPQAVNYAFQINTIARVGGICIRYPFAMAKMDLDA